jgi:hypothetical protein
MYWEERRVHWVGKKRERGVHWKVRMTSLLEKLEKAIMTSIFGQREWKEK